MSRRMKHRTKMVFTVSLEIPERRPNATEFANNIREAVKHSCVTPEEADSVRVKLVSRQTTSSYS